MVLSPHFLGCPPGIRGQTPFVCSAQFLAAANAAAERMSGLYYTTLPGKSHLFSLARRILLSHFERIADHKKLLLTSFAQNMLK